MLLQNEICEVDIRIDITYTVESACNKQYDLVYNPDKYRNNDFYKTLALNINLYSEKINIALLGDFYTYETECAVLDRDILTVLQNDTITQINVIDGSLVLHKQFDCFGCNYGIYRVNIGYIIYGEIEIIMLDFKFNKKWAFSGRDIFVSLSAKKSFEIYKDRIKLYDFEDNYYEIDFNGKIVS